MQKIAGGFRCVDVEWRCVNTSKMDGNAKTGSKQYDLTFPFDVSHIASTRVL